MSHLPFYRSFYRAFRAPVLLLACLAGATPRLHAQADAYTGTQGLRLQGFGAVSYVRPDYGGAKKNAGGTVGLDADVRAFYGFKPGLEIRAAGSGGRVSDQYSFSGGPRVIYGHGRVQPYADFLLGYGQIKFNQGPDPFYQKDHTMVYTYGGGADFVVSPSWALKADIQTERWRLTSRAPAFHPLAVSVGVRYTLHFHNRNSPD